jgi:hypothetical protein
MSSRLWSRLDALLHKPLFGSTAILRGARLDSSRFTEDEFPVSCARCGYLLRGLPDGLCPECGEPFDRAGLLVQEYIHDPVRHPVTHARWKLIERVAFVYVIVFLALVFSIPLLVLFFQAASVPLWLKIPIGAVVAAAVLFLAGASIIYVAVAALSSLAWLFLKPADFERKRARIRDAVLGRRGMY